MNSSAFKNVIFGMALPECPQRQRLYSLRMKGSHKLNEGRGEQPERNLVPGCEKVICQIGNENWAQPWDDAQVHRSPDNANKISRRLTFWVLAYCFKVVVRLKSGNPVRDNKESKSCWKGSVGKCTCCQAWEPESDPWVLHCGSRKLAT